MANFSSHYSGMTTDARDQLRQQGIAIIDHPDPDHPLWSAEDQLEKIMESGQRVIIIEPKNLAELTTVWIQLGNFVNKVAVLSGIGAITTNWFLPQKPYIYCSFGTISFFSTIVYGFAWQFDPCTKYRVEKNKKKLQSIPLHLVSPNSTILIRRDTFLRNFSRISVSFSAVGYCLWNFYKLYKNVKFDL